MSVKPIREKLVVKPAEKEEKTSGGIFLTDSSKDNAPQKGEVIAVGSGHITVNGEIVPLEIKAGDTVFYAKGAGKKVTANDEELVILAEDEILAIIE
jgi:chaperonin GroES